MVEGARKVFVLGIPQHLTEDTVRQYFEQFGPVIECAIPSFPARPRSGCKPATRGFAFVKFEDEASVLRALSKPQHVIQSQKVEVKRAMPPALPGCKLYVGNLPSQATEESIAEYFGRFGDVERTVVVRNKSGLPRGFGFVHFRNKLSLENALKMPKHKLGDKEIKVSEAASNNMTPRARDAIWDNPPPAPALYYGYYAGGFYYPGLGTPTPFPATGAAPSMFPSHLQNQTNVYGPSVESDPAQISEAECSDTRTSPSSSVSSTGSNLPEHMIKLENDAIELDSVDGNHQRSSQDYTRLQMMNPQSLVPVFYTIPQPIMPTEMFYPAYYPIEQQHEGFTKQQISAAFSACDQANDSQNCGNIEIGIQSISLASPAAAAACHPAK